VEPLGRELDNGFVATNSPRPGQTGLRRVSGRPNGFGAKLNGAAKEQARNFEFLMVVRQRAVVRNE